MKDTSTMSPHVSSVFGLSETRPHTDPLTRFLEAGALSLSHSELFECAAKLKKAGQPDPLDNPLLRSRDILRHAVEQNVDLGAWDKRVSFLIGEALASEASAGKSQNPKEPRDVLEKNQRPESQA